MVESVSSGIRSKTIEERRAILDQEAKRFAGTVGRITFESPTSVIVTKGKPVTSILYPVLTVMTLGIWGIVWFLQAKFRGEKRWRLSVDESGQVTTRRI